MNLYKVTSEWRIDQDPQVHYVVATDVQCALKEGKYFPGAVPVASVELIAQHVIIEGERDYQPDASQGLP